MRSLGARDEMVKSSGDVAFDLDLKLAFLSSVSRLDFDHSVVESVHIVGRCWHWNHLTAIAQMVIQMITPLKLVRAGGSCPGRNRWSEWQFLAHQCFAKMGTLELGWMFGVLVRLYDTLNRGWMVELAQELLGLRNQTLFELEALDFSGL